MNLCRAWPWQPMADPSSPLWLIVGPGCNFDWRPVRARLVFEALWVHSFAKSVRESSIFWYYKYSMFPNKCSPHWHVTGLSQGISIDIWVEQSFDSGFLLALAIYCQFYNSFQLHNGWYLCPSASALNKNIHQHEWEAACSSQALSSSVAVMNGERSLQ